MESAETSRDYTGLIMGKNYTARKPESERPKGDFYGTPISLLWELFKAENKQRYYYGDTLEPFCGKGNLSNEIKKHFNIGYINKRWYHTRTSFDLNYGENRQDFLKYNRKHETIISNPPFSQFDDMVMHSKEVAQKIYLIGKTNFYGAFKRNERGVWKHLKKIYVFNRQVDYRTPYREDGCFHVGNLVTGWHCWDMSYNGLTTWEIMDVNKYATLGAHPDSRVKK